MARFEGAKKVDRKEARMGFSLGERLKAAGFEAAKSEVREKAEDDKAEVKAVGSTIDSPEITQINTEAEQALDENVEVTEAQLSEVSEQIADKELSLEKEALINQVNRLANDAEEISLQINGAHSIVEDAMASGGIVPKSLRRLSESYDEGERGFQGIEQSMRDLVAGLATIAATSENLDAGKVRMEELSVRVGIFKRFFKDLLEKKMKLVKVDADKMQERGDGELDDSVEKITYLNEQFFNDVESLGAKCDAVAKGELSMSNVERQTSNVEVVTSVQEQDEPEVLNETVKPNLRLVDTSEIDEGWEDDQNKSEMRKTLRGGFVPTVIEGGKGNTEIAETGPTGTLVGIQEEMLPVSEAYVTPELLKDIPYPSPDDRENTVGMEYLTPEEMEEFGEVPSVASQKVDNTTVEKNEPSVPDTLLDSGSESMRLAMEVERERMEKEQELMDLLRVFEGATEINKEDRNRVVTKGESLLQEYADEYGDEEKQKIAEKWVDKLGELLDEANARNSASAKKTSSPFVEGALAAAGIAAAAKAIEIGGETLRDGDDYRDKGNDSGSFEDTIISKDFTREHWGELTLEEQNRVLELYSEIDNQEHDLGNLKNAKNAMERALRVQYGDQFEVSARAQKTLREKASQIQKMEMLLLKNKNEQKLLKERAKERLQARQGTIESVVQNMSGTEDKDKAWENEEFPAKSSWWKEHPRMRKVAIAGGVVGGAGLFAGAWVASKLLTPIIHPFKTLEFLGNATDKFFKFLDRVLVKGDPLGAISDVAKSAEKFFDDKMNKAEEKSKGKGGKGFKYSSTE